MKGPENEISIIRGTLKEFANAFTINQPVQPGSNSDNAFPRIYHGSPDFPYEKVTNFLHKEADIWVTSNQRIVNIKLIKSSENNVSASKPKTLLQRLLRIIIR